MLWDTKRFDKQRQTSSVCVLGRVVNVSSFVGYRALTKCSAALQERFRSEDITEEELVELMEKFVDEAKKGQHQKGGWPDTSYGMSKTGLTVRPGTRSKFADLKIRDQRLEKVWLKCSSDATFLFMETLIKRVCVFRRCPWSTLAVCPRRDRRTG